MAAAILQHHTVRQTPTPPPMGTTTISLTASSTRSQTPIPNKHLPICPTGPAPASSKLPAASYSSSSSSSSKQFSVQHPTALYPPDNRYHQVYNHPPVFSINGKQLAIALDDLATRPLPDPSKLFPWLHGLHPENQIQLSFFVSRRRTLRRIPKCLRSITVVKVGGDLTKAKLKGAVAPDEILAGSSFIDADPPEGFSVRNFHIQTAKLAAISDIIVYGDDDVSEESILAVAVDISTAQEEWMRKYDPGQETRLFNTFVVSSSFQDIERQHPDIVAINQNGVLTGQVMDFFLWERLEMYSMSQATEITKNVWQGPSPDLSYDMGGPPTSHYDVFIETHDGASIPDTRYLTKISSQLHKGPHHIEFPSSGSIMASSWSQLEVYDFIATCRWIYQLANPRRRRSLSENKDGDIPMKSATTKPYKIFIHCGDGYTESSLLALAYFMYAEGAPVHEAWLRLHCEKKRNFFAYPTDVTFLLGIQQKLLSESPNPRARQLTHRPSPNWMTKMDGSLPSRILPYMYLGNLAHATNPELLWPLGIRRILSVGEPLSWMAEDVEKWGAENLLYINEVQDNGIDPLTQELERCLAFIDAGKFEGTATLVHCRVGVSRSATICIAEVMKTMNLSFPRAYCFVRARRLNVIIQPHLRFVYELLKWDEILQHRRGNTFKRDLEWPTVAREIALMNKPYSRQ
ncbi:hypothetical protein H109_02749 [Trichophyton interdigitale MR816]|uniref:Uncharacterized protein n=1 Tax=Trichophyton interdigitale (strain MR816) TaxID=1215338 RepID=A0A059JC38_TRIIM|nr:hypothetical protein H101_06706 [Trichophyton interdigitale H6]KDB25456.1 hypothetical protein H109_02749 [Trichophyton interdigitale MR816]